MMNSIYKPGLIILIYVLADLTKKNIYMCIYLLLLINII